MAAADAPPDTPAQGKSKITDETRAALEAAASGLPPEVHEATAAQLEEWGTWIAAEPIFYGGVLAVNTGHAVPNDNVAKYKYDDLGWVVKRDSKEGKALLTSLGMEG